MRPFVIPLLSFYVAYVASQCYSSNGSLIDSLEYQPCNLIEGTVSMCCATNRTLPSGSDPGIGSVRDICLPNGICQSIWQDGASGPMQYWYFRDFCSASNWEGCLKGINDSNPVRSRTLNQLFELLEANVQLQAIQQLTPCDGDSINTTRWCLGQNASTCCTSWENNTDAITIPLLLSQANTGLAGGESGSGLSTRAKVGIIIGTVGGGFLLFASGYFLRGRRKHYSNVTEKDIPHGGQGYHAALELPVSGQMYELPAGKQMQELG